MYHISRYGKGWLKIKVIYKVISYQLSPCTQYEDVLKLVRILRSQSMDESLKKSALDQLSLILRGNHITCNIYPPTVRPG